MKILQVINSLEIGGAEKLITDIIPRLDKNGIKCDILLLNDSNTILKEQLTHAGITIYTHGRISLLNPIHIFKISTIIKKYNIIHSHLFPSLYWVALATLFNRIKPIMITTEHSTHNRRRNNVFLRLIDRFIYSLYNKIICISDDTKSNLLPIIGLKNKSKICVIHNGVDIEQYIKAQPYSTLRSLLNKEVADDSKLILQVAGFRPAKDQETLIRSLLHLPSNYLVAFVGKGETMNACKRLVNELSLGERVFFLGFRDDIPEITNTADLIVVSSKWEGFGLVAVEGMAAAKPVIASNVVGLAGVVENAGLLFNQGDEKVLAQHINKVLEDKKLYARLVNNSLNRSKMFGINETVMAYENIYKSLNKN